MGSRLTSVVTLSVTVLLTLIGGLPLSLMGTRFVTLYRNPSCTANACDATGSGLLRKTISFQGFWL